METVGRSWPALHARDIDRKKHSRLLSAPFPTNTARTWIGTCGWLHVIILMRSEPRGTGPTGTRIWIRLRDTMGTTTFLHQFFTLLYSSSIPEKHCCLCDVRWKLRICSYTRNNFHCIVPPGHSFYLNDAMLQKSLYFNFKLDGKETALTFYYIFQPSLDNVGYKKCELHGNPGMGWNICQFKVGGDAK